MKSLFRKLGIAITWRAALPLAWLWVKLHQRRILNHGRPLTDDEICLAEELGIEHGTSIRIWSIDQVPSPGGVLLSGLGRFAGISTHGAKAWPSATAFT